MNRRLLMLLVLAAALACLTLAAAAQPAPRDTGAVAYFTGVAAGSACDFIRTLIYFRTEGTTHMHFILANQGHVVADIVLESLPYENGFYAALQTDFQNDTGLAPVDYWPLTPGSKVTLKVTMLNGDWEPVYETRATMKSCDKLKLKKSSHGPAYQLVQNDSFEQAYVDSAGTLSHVAMFWKPKNALNDIRECAGSSNYLGSCGYQFSASAATTTTVKQKFAGAIGVAGDTVTLGTFVQSYASYTGGGKLKANLKFANGATKTLVVSFPPGPYLYPAFPGARLHSASYTMPATLVSATVTIQQKNGTGIVAVDGVTLTVFSNNGAVPRALPAPQSGA